MTDAETLQAYVGGQPPQTDQPPSPSQLPNVAAPAPVTTGADVAVLQDYVGTQPMFRAQGQPPPSPALSVADLPKRLPPFPEAPPVDITAGAEARMAAAGPEDIGTLDNYITNNAEKAQQEHIDRVAELVGAAKAGLWQPPDGWLHALSGEMARFSPSSWDVTKQWGRAALDFFGVPEEVPDSTLGRVGTAMLQAPRTATAMTQHELAAIKALYGAGKTGVGAIEEAFDPSKGNASDKAAWIGFVKGAGSLYPLYNDVVGYVAGLTGVDRARYIERALRAYRQATSDVQNQERIIDYDPTLAPDSEKLGEFIGQTAPFGVEEAGAKVLGTEGLGSLATRYATKLATGAIRPVVERAEPIAAAAVAKTAPKIGAAAKELPVAAASAGLGYMFGDRLGYGHLPTIIGGVLGLSGRPTLRTLVSTFTKAGPEASEAIGPYLVQSVKEGRPLASAMQEGVQDDIGRLTVQQRMIRSGASDIEKTDARMPNGDNVFTKDEIKNSAIAVRDNIAAQQKKLASLGYWAKYERLFSDMATLSLASGAATVPTGLVLGGINALEAPPGKEREAAYQGMQTGMNLMLPVAPGMVSRAYRESAVRGLMQRGRANAITPDHPDYTTNMIGRRAMSLTPQGRLKLDAVDQFAGLLAPMGTKVVGLSPQEMERRFAPQPAEPVPAMAAVRGVEPAAAAPMPPTGERAPNGLYEPSTNTIYYNYAAPMDTLGHELSHPFEQAVGENLVGNRIRRALSNPADQPAIQTFLNQYKNLMQRTNPNFAGLTPDQQISEMFAELGRDVLRETPPVALYGGRSGMQIITDAATRVADMIRGRRETTREIQPSPGQIGLRAPQFPGTRAAMQDLLFGLGERAKYRQTYGLRAEAPPTAAEAAAAPVPPPTVLSPAEQQVLHNVVAGSQKLGGIGASAGDVGDAIAAAKQAGVEVNESNILNMVINQANGRDIFHGIEMPVKPVGVAAVPTPAAPPVTHPDYEAIRRQAEDVERRKGSKAKDAEAKISKAGIQAAAQSHAQAVGPDSDLITWRTNKYGKSWIGGTKADPNDPFNQMILQRLNLNPEALQNLNDLEANMGRAIAVDYSHAPEEGGAVTQPERQAARAAATAPERVAGEVAREKLTKSFVPTSFTYNPESNTIVAEGFSPDKLLNNANEVIDFARTKGIRTFKDVNDPLLVQYIGQLTENHQNGFTGNGKPIKGTGITPVTQTPGYKAHIIPKDYLDQINLMMGNTGARVGEKVKAARLKGITPEAEAAKFPEQAEKRLLAQQNSPYFDPVTGEVNKLRAQMGERANRIEPVYERLRPELIDRVRREPVEDQQTLRPSGFTGDRAQFSLRGLPQQEFVAGGFMPATEPRPGAEPTPLSKEERSRIVGQIQGMAIQPRRAVPVLSGLSNADIMSITERLSSGSMKKILETEGIFLTNPREMKSQLRDLVNRYKQGMEQQERASRAAAQYMPATAAEGAFRPSEEEIGAGRARGRIGTPALWDTQQTAGHADELAKELGVDPKKRFWEQKPAAQQKITDHFRSLGAQYMPATGERPIGYVGHVDDYGEIEATRARLGEGPEEHEKLGYGGLGWRYNPDTKSVYWWGEPEEAERAAVKNWLGGRGELVERHIQLSSALLGKEDFGRAFDEAHGIRQGPQYMPATGFYSKALRAIDEKMPEKGEQPVGQVKAMLRNSGIGPNEMEWSGMNLIDDDQKMSKKGYQEMIRDVLPNVTTTTLGGGGMSRELWNYIQGSRESIPVNASQWINLANDLNGLADRFGLPEHRELAKEARGLSFKASVGSGPTQYSRYVLPGGYNYREILLHQPALKAEQQSRIAAAQDRLRSASEAEIAADKANNAAARKVIDLHKEGRFKEEQIAFKAMQETYRKLDNARTLRVMAERTAELARTETAAFTSPHFGSLGENLIGHLRTTDRTTTGGNKMLLSEEMQSDWGQAIREQGVAEKVDPKSLDMAEGEHVWSYTDPRSGESYQVAKPGYATTIRGPAENETEARQIAARFFSEEGGVPDMPFKGAAWKKLLMRQLIKTGVEEGKDSVGWTTGAQQADRYNLSHYVDYITARKNADGTFDIDYKAKDDPSVRILGAEIKPEELDAQIGKDLANKVRRQEDRTDKYEGGDLKIGGEGMKGFYDKELVNIANDIGKKFGAKVQDAQIRTSQDLHPDLFIPTKTMGETVHELPITPQMRASVQTQGQPLFMPSTHPDAIDRAALMRESDQKIFPALERYAPHYMIPQGYGDEISDYLGINGQKLYREGFVTNKGEFQDREMAFQTMQRLGQLPKSYREEYAGEADVTALRKAQFMPATAGAAHMFYSPNEGDLTWDQALVALGSPKQEYAQDVGRAVDHALGLSATYHDAIGDTKSYGTENSVVSEMSNIKDFDELRYAAALRGRDLNQKSVLAFMEHDDGDHTLYSLTVPQTDLPKLREQLDKVGLEFRTFRPSADDTQIQIFSRDPEADRAALQKFATVYSDLGHDIEIQHVNGTGEFVGEADTREEAQRNYAKIIEDYEGQYPLRPHASAQGARPDYTSGTQPALMPGTGPRLSAEQQKAWDEIARYLTPEQLGTVAGQFRDRIIEPYLQLDSDFGRSLLFAERGAFGRKWYGDFVNAIHDMLGSDNPQYVRDPERFAALMAALSANRSVPENVEHSLMAWALWEAQGRPQDRASIEDIIHATVSSAAETEEVKSSLPAWLNNSFRAFTAEDPSTIRLSGPKVHNFYRNLIGDVHAVTVDRHMGIFGYGTPKLGSRPKKIGGEKVGIESFKNLAMQAHIRKVADVMTRISGETWTPAEVQAAIWTYQLPVQDLADKLGVTVNEFLTGGGKVPQELIEAAPSAKLLQSEKSQATIRRLQGLREANIRASREAGAGVGGEGAEISGEAGGAEPRRTGRGETPFRAGGVVKSSSGVYLIRHGCTTLNAQSSKRSPDVIRGHVDVPLNEKGHAQAAKLGKDLANKGIEAVFSSDLSRSIHTAAPIAHSNGAPIIPLYGLRPWDLGHTIQGKRADEVQPKIDHLIDNPDEVAEGGESANDFKDRFLSTLRNIVNNNRGRNIAVVTHFRGVKLLASLDKNGETDNDAFKKKGGALDPGACQFLELSRKPVKGIPSHAES